MAESVNLKTQKVIFYEEFFPIGTVDTQTLEFYQRQTEQLPLSLLNLSLSEPIIQQANYHQDIKEVYVAKCETDQGSRYAICWKPNCFVDHQYQKSFASISEFGSPSLNLANKLDLHENPWLVEISEEDYQRFTERQANVKDYKINIKK